MQERGRLTDKEEEEEEEREREREDGREQIREGGRQRCYWSTVITSSVIEIFLSQSEKYRKTDRDSRLRKHIQV